MCCIVVFFALSLLLCVVTVSNRLMATMEGNGFSDIQTFRHLAYNFVRGIFP